MAKIDTPIPLLKLNDGTSIPMLAYGTGTARSKSKDDSAMDRPLVEAVKTALKLGYMHIDAAQMYHNEAEVGVAIKESKVPRDKLFITTKAGPGVTGIAQALEASLHKLQVDYVDLYLIHEPFTAKSASELQAAWSDMEAIKAAGKARSIGVSNFQIEHFDIILKHATIRPSINQIEYHPYLQQDALLAYQKEHGIAVSAYSPLTAAYKAKPGPADPLLAQLSKKYYVSENEVSLRWCIDQDIVAITTSGSEQRMSDYLRAMVFSLTPRECKDLAEAGRQKHFRAYWRSETQHLDPK